MNNARSILIKTLVKPYYQQNAGLFSFLVFIMFFAVGRANEAGLLEYHYSLIQGMMINPEIFIIVLLAWCFYAKKCEQFIYITLHKKEFAFLQTLSLLKPRRAYGLMLLVQCLLFLPILLYVLIIVAVGFHNQWNTQVTLILVFNLVLCTVLARWYLHLIQNPGSTFYILRWRLPTIGTNTYWTIVVRYVFTRRKMLFSIIKIYDCCFLYFLIRNLTPQDHDLSMIVLFYSFGLLGHGVLIHKIRSLEESSLTYYKGLPVSLTRRWGQYLVVYLILFSPELLTISLQTPKYLSLTEALLFSFFGYNILLLMNSLLFIKAFKMVDYLKIVTGIYFIIFIAVLTGVLKEMSVISLLVAYVIFTTRYYKYE